VPTAVETAPGYVIVTRYAVLAPGATPRPIVEVVKENNIPVY